MNLRKSTLSLAFAIGVAGAAAPSLAANYVMSASSDFTGPFADISPSAVSGIRAVAAWWNATKGKELDVRVDIKTYDMRYDASVVARIWPSILSTDKPILHLGFGTPDLITLMKRLPGDKVPMLMSTAMGLVWQPNGWHFSFRPTYSQEFAGLLSHLQQKKGGKLKIGAISTQSAAGFVDQVKGVQKFAATKPDKFQVLDVQWVDASPVSVANEVRSSCASSPTSCWSAVPPRRRSPRENGRIVLHGEREKLEQNEDVREFYLGLSLDADRRSFRNVKHYKRGKRWLG